MHVHLTSLAEVGGYQALRYTDSFWTVVGAANAKTTLDAGFTTVRNVGSADFEDVGLKQAIEGGEIPGPRSIPAGCALGRNGGPCEDRRSTCGERVGPYWEERGCGGRLNKKR